MNHATYIGPSCGWNVESGQKALIRKGKSIDVVLAQFDDFYVSRAGKDLSHGWHEFSAADFKTDTDSILEVTP